MNFIVVWLLVQLRMILMMAKENARLCGLFSKLLIRRAGIFLISFTGGKRSPRNYMSFAWIKDMLIEIWLRNGKRYVHPLCFSSCEMEKAAYVNVYLFFLNVFLFCLLFSTFLLCVGGGSIVVYTLAQSLWFCLWITAWLWASLLFEVHATAGSQLSNNLCLSSSTASKGGEGYRMCPLRL